VAWAFAEFVNEESYKFAATGKAEYPFVAPEGGKEPLRAEYSAYTMGSDHDVYQDSSFGIPAIYMNDWPDRYIHTNFDTAANIDTTKLKRAAFIGAASGYFLAGLTGHGHVDLFSTVIRGRNFRLLSPGNRPEGLSETDKEAMRRSMARYDGEEARSLYQFSAGHDGSVQTPIENSRSADKRPEAAGEGRLVYLRKREPKGPLAVFGYDYFADHSKAAGVAEPRLMSYEGLWGSGEEYAYEVLNFADGKRNAQEIRDAVSAEYGPVPLEMVMEYLRALEKIGLVGEVK
jgi:aminopeptidase YwaD